MVANPSLLDAPALDAPALDGRVLDALFVGLVAAAAALIYGLIHRNLAIEANAYYATINRYAVLRHPVRDAITFSLGPFLAVVLGSMSLAALKHRVAAFGIFVLVAATPLVQAALGVLPADRSIFAVTAPNPLGAFWTFGYGRPPVAQLWRATVVDYGLALLPALAIAVWTLRAGAVTPVRRPTMPEAAGLSFSVLLFGLVLHTWELHETLQGAGATRLGTDVAAFLPFFLLGLVLARGTAWRFVALCGVPILWSTTWVPRLVIGDLRGFDSGEFRDAIPFVAVVAAGALWYPIASRVGTKTTRPWVAVIALNALNEADVLFTRLAVHSGGAVEANPFATWIGPGLKLAGVAVASVLLARWRPRALIWLVLVFVALTAWHLSGLILDTT